MGEFFGIPEYQRLAEGFMSWQHLLFVTILNVAMVVAAVVLGKIYKNKEASEKNKVLIVTAILVNFFEVSRYVVFCLRAQELSPILYNLPLFLCGIQLIAIPIAAFSKGRLKEAALDFVLLFGVLGAVLGTYGAGQNYACYPVLSFDNVSSGLTHVISGFASIYVATSGMVRMRLKNIWITISILLGFVGAALLANQLLDYNYMFLRRGDGTPYDIIYNLVGGNPILYPIFVVGLFFVYMFAFYGIYYLARRIKKRVYVAKI